MSRISCQVSISFFVLQSAERHSHVNYSLCSCWYSGSNLQLSQLKWTFRLEVVNIVSLSQPLPPPNYHWHSSTKQCFSSISTQTQQKCKVLSGFSTGGVGVWWEGVRCCLWGLPRGWALGWLWQSQQTQTQINQSILNSTQTVQFPHKLPQVVLKYE